MGVTWFGTIIDSHDPDSLAQFWCQVLGYVVVFHSGK
ncbi:MAG: VOC family protein [Nocardioidaceae bacterium]